LRPIRPTDTDMTLLNGFYVEPLSDEEREMIRAEAVSQINEALRGTGFELAGEVKVNGK
jgi:hypothetical protein